MNHSLSATTRLIFSGRAWHQLRPLLIDRGSFAVGDVQSREAMDGRELLVSNLTIVREVADGMDRSPLDEWAVVVFDHDNAITPEILLRQIGTKRSHCVVGVVLRDSDTATCQAAMLENDCISVIDELRISGPGMLRLSRVDEPPMDFQFGDNVRWSRTAGALGEQLARRLRNMSVTLVGCGRLGSQMAFQLAALGISTIRLIDGDHRLGLENLDAMPGLVESDVGRPKAPALADRLCAFRPDMAVSFVDTPLTDPRAQALLERRADLLVTCVDNDTARLAASLAAQRLLTVHLDVGTSIQRRDDGELDMHADVRLLLPGEGCVACVGGLDDPLRRMYDVSTPAGALTRGQRIVWHEQRAGSLITINGLAVSTAVQSWLDLCSAHVASSYWHRIEWQRGQGIAVDQGPVTGVAACPFCRITQQ